VGVKEQQRPRFDPNRDLTAAQDLGGEQLAAAEPDQAGVVDGAVDLDRTAMTALDDRQRRRAGRACALTLQPIDQRNGARELSRHSPKRC
jgi:hypothetical protein